MSTLIAVRGLADQAYLLERVVADVQGAIADSGYSCERVDVEISRLALPRGTSGAAFAPAATPHESFTSRATPVR